MSARDPTIAKRSKRYRENRKRRRAAAPADRSAPGGHCSVATATEKTAQNHGETAVDGLALALPAAAVALWHSGRGVLALAAWIVAGAAVVGATLASLGFAQLHFGDTAASRAAVVTSTNAVADRRAAGVAAAERAVNAAARAREAECAIRGPRCRDRETG